MTRIRQGRPLAGAAVALAAGAAWLAASSQAIIINGQPAKFGLVGVAHGQTMRLAVSNLGGPDTAPCRVALGFADTAGRALGPVPHLHELAPETSEFVSLAGPERGRLEVHPVAGIGDPNTCQVAFSVQVVAGDGHTAVMIGDPNLVPAAEGG